MDGEMIDLHYNGAGEKFSGSRYLFLLDKGLIQGKMLPPFTISKRF